MALQTTSYGIQRPQRKLGSPSRNPGMPLDDPSEDPPPAWQGPTPSVTVSSTSGKQPAYGIEAPQNPDGTPAEMPTGQNGEDPRAAAAEDTYYEAVNRVPQKMPRWKAALKMLAIGLGRTQPGDEWSDVAKQVGYGAGAALGGAIDPSQPNRIQRDYDIDRSYSTLKQIETIENSKSLRSNRNFNNQYKTTRLAQFNTAAEERQRFNSWRMKSGDRKADEYHDWLAWRKNNGDAQQKTRDDYNIWRREAEQRTDSDRDRAFEHRVDQDKVKNELAQKHLELAQRRENRMKAGGGGGADSSEEEIAFWSDSADIYKNNAETAAESGNDEEEATFRALERSARIKSGDAAAHGIRTRAKGGASGASGSFKYTEQDVRARARAANADEEAAVQKARAGKLIP